MRLPRRLRPSALPAPAGSRPRLPRVTRGAVVGILVVGLLAGLGAVALVRKTSLFDVKAVEVHGAPARVERDVRRALAALEGTSLVDVDASAVEVLARRVPSVRRVTVDRDFPDRVTVRVALERPVAVLRLADSSWLVAESGKVLRTLGPDVTSTLPRIWLGAEVQRPRVGATLASAETRSAIRALARLPKRFPVRVLSARGSEADLTLVLGGPAKTELRLGEADSLRLKLAVAARVLTTMGSGARHRLAYLDVSVPERPVSKDKSQLAS